MHSLLFTGSHSLWVLSTFIIGDTPFPEFSAVVMLDDIQLFYYDADVQKLIYKQNSKHEPAKETEARLIFGHQYNSMRERAFFFQKQLNFTHGNCHL